MADTYQIVRFYQQGNIRRRVIDTRLTLEEAKKHCNDPESSSSTCTGATGKRRTKQRGPWFDGFEKE